MFKPKLFVLLPKITKEQLISDSISGVLVGIVALPLAIAFGVASGVSPVTAMLRAGVRVGLGTEVEPLDGDHDGVRRAGWSDGASCSWRRRSEPRSSGGASKSDERYWPKSADSSEGAMRRFGGMREL